METAQQSWVQCSDCQKWRKLAAGRSEWSGDFVCSMNMWKPALNSCAAAEEASGETVQKNKKRRQDDDENAENSAAPKQSRMILIPLDPVARVEQYEAFRLPEIDENLFVGSAEAAKCLPWLRKAGVKYILNMTQKGQVPEYYPDEIEYLRVPIEDLIDAKIELIWSEAFEFLDKATKSGDKVLVHCRAGRSRSCAVCVAYGMRRGLTLCQSYESVLHRRSRMKVNLGFQMALMQLEKTILKVETNSMDFFGKRKRIPAPRYQDE